MIFTSRNTYAELIQGPKGGTEEALLKMVHDTWGKFNQFLDNNLKMLLIFIKDITQLRDRQKEQVMSLIQTHKGMSSHSASDEGSPDSPTMVKSNGMIYHDFNYPEYVNQRFAEEEVMKKDFYLIACEPEAEKETKIPEYSITDKNLTPYQIEMRKMKTVIKKAEIHASENVNGAAEFRAQFTDFLKNVNQSYAILKGSTAEDKTKKDDKADKTTVAEDIGQSSLNLFQKTKTKKKFTISEMKPRAKVEPRVASAVLNDNSKVGGSSRRLSAVKNPRRLNDSSIKYDDSDSGIKVIGPLLGQNHDKLWQIGESRQKKVPRDVRQSKPDP
jgi:hypothetical protein